MALTVKKIRIREPMEGFTQGRVYKLQNPTTLDEFKICSTKDDSGKVQKVILPNPKVEILR